MWIKASIEMTQILSKSFVAKKKTDFSSVSFDVDLFLECEDFDVSYIFGLSIEKRQCDKFRSRANRRTKKLLNRIFYPL